MEIEEIKKIIVDQKEEIEELFQKEKIIERELDPQRLKRFLKYPNILVISGVRRSGKSVLALLLLKEEKYGYINFDDERLVNFTKNDLNKLLQAFYELYGENLEYFIFDEIQNIENWELFITRLRRTKKIIITGSNAKLLSSELSTHLTGRYVDFTLYPFSFREYLKFQNVILKKEDFYSTKKISQIKRLLKEYIALGGFPEVFKFGKTIIKRIYGDIVNKDILFRYKIKNKSAFRELAKYLVSNFGQKISYSKLKNIFAIKNVHTIKNYVEYLSSVFLVFVLDKFFYKLKQQFIAPKKIYVVDTGLIISLAFQFSENTGRLIENVVLSEILRKKAYLDEELEIYYWQDYFGKEVDFVLKKNRKIIQLIQVCVNISDLAVKKREINSLIKASEQLKCNNLLVITSDYEGQEKVKNKKINFIPLWKWLITY
ncbi:ATP-binding protein [Patescibacteria group bacterium]|nr:ATP-binding protein [Patescibacteria group bacterium]MBU4480771.1 ATP-binding protein [Patescibacteria group bacterium]